MIYVDNNATTRIGPEVLNAMQPFLTEFYGNPSSMHSMGQEARKAVNEAREKTALFLEARHDSEILFTSGGTESNNLAIRGVLKSVPARRHLITTRVEHPSVLNVFKELASEGYAVTFLEVDSEGRLDLNELRDALSPDTLLVSIMAVNNETGVIFPVDEIAQFVKSCGAFFHVDAVQAAGRIPISLKTGAIDLLSISGHKLHAPKGVGALYVKKGTPLSPLMIGGAQERDKRAGTENVASIVGLGKACEMADEDLAGRNEKLARLRNKLEAGILKSVENTCVNGGGTARVTNTTNITFKGLDSESILLSLNEEGICASSGSACTTGAVQFSHVLLAMGFPEEYVRGALRFTLSRFNHEDEIDVILRKIPGIICRLRAIHQTSGV